MNIIVLILIVFFAISGMIVARVIINKRKRRRKAKKEEEKAREEQEKRRQEKEQKRLEGERRREEEEEERKRLEEEHRRKEEELRLAEDRRCIEAESLEKIKAEEEKIEREAREKASKEKAERVQLEAEEKESKAKEEANSRKAEEEKTRKERVQEEEKLKSRLEEERQELPPDKRGGRSRGSTKQRTTASSRELRPRPLKPEIVCWNKGWEWIVGIEVPEEFASPRVTQNDELLEQDTSDAALYHLRHFEGIVRVAQTAEEQDREIDIPLMEEGRDYLILKMRKEWKGLGRVVRHPTTGYYLAIVPYEWKWDEETSGSAKVAPENVQIQGYKAHFFVREDQETAIAFIDAKGERIQVKSGGSSFQLIGKKISDSSEDMGPLFGEEPPLIKTLDEQGWDNVGVVVVGEEGSGRNRWRTQFDPEKSAEQRMPNELINRRCGWYFVRIYDKNNDLLESMDFRFSAGLKDIRIMNSECLPKPNGYENVIVQFTHQTNCKVEPADENLHRTLSICGEDDATRITIPPNANYDKSHWILRDGEAKTKVTVLVERIWWGISHLNEVPINWTDKTVSLSRKDFTAITDKAIWVKFPRKRWISKIEVGFNRTKSRPYNLEVDKEEIAIPLRDFCDAEEIGNNQVESAMKIWVSSDEAIVLKIPTELLLPSEPKLPRVKPLPPPKLEAEVKSPRGKRKGKGFSRIEIDNAGLTMKQVKRLHIPYDKRRKSSHSWNIERLKSITER